MTAHSAPGDSPEADSALKRRPKNSLKGQQTKAAIVHAALNLATHIGLEGLSIGALAERMQMSKSGVFAHFGSREELQVSVVREYHARFEEEVFYPAMKADRMVYQCTVCKCQSLDGGSSRCCGAIQQIIRY